MNNALLYLGSFLALVLGALFAVPHVVDWNAYRGVFEEEAARVLGRDVRVGGNVAVRLLPVPFVSFEKVRIANAGNLTGQPFFSVESFTMKLAASPLLRGAIEAKEIELERPVLALAVDDEGRGNWSSIEIARRELPFIPADVAFRSVKVSNAEIAIFGPRGNELFRTSDIDGEVTAEGLQGPYAFRGTAAWSGRAGDLKLATTQASADGSFRLKAAIKETATGATGAFDALIKDFSSGVTYSGELTLRTPVSASDVSLPAFVTPVTGQAGDPWADVKASIAGDGRALAVSGLTVTVEQTGEPQIISGDAKVDWSAAPGVDVSLNSRWLDIDKLIGTGVKASPAERIRQLAGLVQKSVPAGTRANIRVALDQVKIAGDDVGSFKFDAMRQDGPLVLKTVEAGLPGGVRVVMSGELGGTQEKPVLQARIEAGGADFHKLARWLQWDEITGSQPAGERGGADPFIVNADVSASAETLSLANLSADIAGMVFTGSAKYSKPAASDTAVAAPSAQRAKLEVTLDAQSIDTSKIFPGFAAALDHRLRRPFVAAGSAAAGEGSDLLRDVDVALTLLSRKVTHNGIGVEDVSAVIANTGDAAEISQLSFTTAEGLRVSVRGNASGVAAAPGNSASFDLSGSGAALAQALKPFGLPAAAFARLSRITDASLAGVAALGGDGTGKTSVTVDGTADDAIVSGRAAFDGGWLNWRSAPLDGRLLIEAADGEKLLAVLGNRVVQAKADVPVPGRLTVDLAGVASDRMFTSVALSGPGLALALAGNMSLKPVGVLSAEGTSNTEAQSLRGLLSLAGIEAPQAFEAIPAKGAAKVALGPDGLAADLGDMAIGTAKVSGKLKWKPASAGKPGTIGGDIAADRIRLHDLLDAILIARPAGAPQPPAAQPAAQTPAAVQNAEPVATLWPDTAFDLSALSAIEGNVRLRAAALDVAAGLPIADASLDLSFTGGSVRVSKLGGAAAGGMLEGEAAIAHAPGGAEIWLKAKVADAEATRLVPAAAGTGSLTIELAGRAQSPAGFIAVAEGNGELNFADLSIPGPSPDLVRNMANSVISGTTPPDPKAMTAFVEASAAAGVSNFGKGTAKLKVKDGAVRIAALTTKTADGEASLLPTLDLATLSLDAAWQLAPPPVTGFENSTGKKSGPLPGASVIYIARLQDIASRQVVVDVAELQRELSVRKLETSVDELERLRKLDEERARIERERRIAIEAERQRQEKLRAEALEAERRAAEEALKAKAAETGAGTDVPAGFPAAGGEALGASAAPLLPEAPPAGNPAAAAQSPPADPNAAPAAANPVRTYQGTRRSNTQQRQSRQRLSPGDEILRQLGGSVN